MLTPSDINFSASEVQPDNALKTGLSDIDEISMFGLGATAIYFIILVMIALTIWMTNSTVPIDQRLGVIAIVEILMIILGTITGVLNTGLVITVVIVGLIFIGLWLRNQFSGQS